MCDLITFRDVHEALCDLADTMSEHADYLTQLDVAVGDGDHGRNMSLGFGAVCDEISSMSSNVPGSLLRSAGMTLVTMVGGASGPLYGAAFIAAGIAAGSATALTVDDLARLVQAAAEALARRGRCRPGDKTIYDALSPASEALLVAAAEKRSVPYALEAAAKAAKLGMEATTPLVAHRGLATQYGAASVGHQDPGATSCYLIFMSILRTSKRLCAERQK